MQKSSPKAYIDPGLTYICTDPSHERHGAGSLLVGWGIQRSKSEKMPLYLESTLQAANFYKKCGFVAEDTVTLQLPDAGKECSKVYEEIVFTFKP
jgi:GNAT superfamily N-acetyltransferase